MPFSRDLPIPAIEVTSPVAPALVESLPLSHWGSPPAWAHLFNSVELSLLAVKRESSKGILEELVLGKAHGQDWYSLLTSQPPWLYGILQVQENIE